MGSALSDLRPSAGCMLLCSWSCIFVADWPNAGMFRLLLGAAHSVSLSRTQLTVAGSPPADGSSHRPAGSAARWQGGPPSRAWACASVQEAAWSSKSQYSGEEAFNF